MAALKVFTWSDGFHAFTVAASSRPKALAAWGLESDIFKTGLAHELEDGADRKAALASPGAVISRGLAVDIGKAAVKKARPSNAKAKARLGELEAELVALDQAQSEETEALAAQQAALDKERSSLEAKQKKARETLVQSVRLAREKASA